MAKNNPLKIIYINPQIVNKSYNHFFIPVVLFLFGNIMQGFVNKSIDVFLVSTIYGVVGVTFVSLIFRNKSELKSFLIVYCVCIFIGGLVQIYSSMNFGILQSTNDAIGFFESMQQNYSWHECNFLWLNGAPVSRGSPLPLFIWQEVYKFFVKNGIDKGLYIGLMFNAMIMGITGSITIRSAREIFGNDVNALSRVNKLFILCGFFILFGTILIRDCFATMVNSIILWSSVRWLSKPSIKNFTIAIIVTGVSALAMIFIRYKAIAIIGLDFLPALIFWFFLEKRKIPRIVAFAVIFLGLLAISPYIIQYIQFSQSIQSERTEAYLGKLDETSQDESMAMDMIVNQPMPIRLVAGGLSRLIFPLPLWANIKSSVNEYHLLITLNGFYQVVLIPFVFLGSLLIFGMVKQKDEKCIPLLFLLIYFIINYFAVIATSFEQRHIAQFMPALCIIAAIPNTNSEVTKKKLIKIGKFWLLIVIMVHFAYFLLKEAI